MAKLRAPVQALLLLQEGQKPTVPVPPTAMPGDTEFDLTTNVMIGQLAYNIADDLWYYRTIAGNIREIGTATEGVSITEHIESTENPHATTKAHIGLSNVQNVDTTNASNIIAGTISSAVLPPIALVTVQVAVDEPTMLSLETEQGDVVVRSDQNRSYMRASGVSGTMADFIELQTPTDTVLSVNGEIGTVTLTTTNIIEGTNEYYTEAKVSANTDVTANSAKVSAFGDELREGDVGVSVQEFNANTTTQGVITLTSLGYAGALNANYYVLPFTDNSGNWNTAYSWGDHSGLYAPLNHGDHGLALHEAQSDAHPRDTRNELAFTKNTAFNKDFGTTVGTVAQGNDSRVLNGQTAYSWGDHSTESYLKIVDLASQVTGTLADGSLSSNVALKNINNNFTDGQSITTTFPHLDLIDNAQVTGYKRVQIGFSSSSGSPMLAFRPREDDGSFISLGFELNRDGIFWNGGSMYHSGNANLSTVPWNAQTISTSGVTRIDASGNYTGESGTFSGDVSISKAGGASLRFGDSNNQSFIKSVETVVGSDLVFQTYGNNERFRLTPTGTTTTGSSVVSGTVTATNFILSSDERLKTFKDDEEVVNVDSIKIRKFTFNDDETNRDRYGVSAQELQKVAPEMVYEDSDEDKTLRVGYIDFLLAKISNLEERLIKLEEK